MFQSPLTSSIILYLLIWENNSDVPTHQPSMENPSKMMYKSHLQSHHANSRSSGGHKNVTWGHHSWVFAQADGGSEG